MTQIQSKALVGMEIRPQFINYCPITGEQTKKLTENRIIIPDGQAIWWNCSACGGWHMNLKNKHRCPSEIQ